MITLEQAFQNIDNVVAEAPMSRKQHLVLIESIKIVKEAAYPSVKEVEAPESVNGTVREDLKKPEPEGDENDGGTDGDTND